MHLSRILQAVAAAAAALWVATAAASSPPLSGTIPSIPSSTPAEVLYGNQNILQTGREGHRYWMTTTHGRAT